MSAFYFNGPEITSSCWDDHLSSTSWPLHWFSGRNANLLKQLEQKTLLTTRDGSQIVAQILSPGYINFTSSKVCLLSGSLLSVVANGDPSGTVTIV